MEPLSSERGKMGLVEAVKERVPAAEHKQCARHIYASFKKRSKGKQYRKLFWVAAASTTQPKFEAEMNSIKTIDRLAYEHLMERDPKSWCRAFFEVDRACDACENDMSEIFNSVIDLDRKRPLLTMLEEIQIYAMEKIFWGVILSRIQKYKVRIGNDGYAVDLNNNTCGCRSWQVLGILCVHAVATISYLNKNAEDYVAPWFYTTMFLTCYNHTINPLNGSSMWLEVSYMKPLPPQKEGYQEGQPLKGKGDQFERESKGKTRHTISKASAIMRCTICRERGHNRSTCPTRPEDVASTSSTVEPVQVEQVQVDPIQVDDPAQPVDDVQVDDPVNDVPTQPVATGKRI
ncbi:hypothetical protein Lser_V15G13867 [Lactuca serriola]